MRNLRICFMLLVLIPQTTFGQIVITEIMYDVSGTDTGREWVEVKNIGPEPLDISSWKLFEANVNHKLTPITTGIIPSGGFAIIVDSFEKWSLDYPNFNGAVFDSAFSLGNTGETLVIRDESGVDVDMVSYTFEMGAQGDGNSLQKTSEGVFVSAPSTLGTDITPLQSGVPQNTEVHNPDEKSDTNNITQIKNTDTYSTHSSQTVANVSFDAPELVVTSGRSRIGFVGTPLQFQAKIQSMKEIPAGNSASHTWSLGDGSSKSGQFISHTYQYPGDYIVILNSSMGGADAVSKVKVKILDPRVSLTKASSEYIEITNADNQEINLGGWIVMSGSSRAVIPQDTIILARGVLRIPITYLGIREIASQIVLRNPLGKEISFATVSPESLLLGDVAIVLPDGMTEDSFRRNLVYAVENAKHQSKIQTKDLAVSRTHEADVMIVPNLEIATSSNQTASVIYSIEKVKTESLWQKVKHIFKK